MSIHLFVSLILCFKLTPALQDAIKIDATVVQKGSIVHPENGEEYGNNEEIVWEIYAPEPTSEDDNVRTGEYKQMMSHYKTLKSFKTQIL